MSSAICFNLDQSKILLSCSWLKNVVFSFRKIVPYIYVPGSKHSQSSTFVSCDVNRGLNGSVRNIDAGQPSQSAQTDQGPYSPTILKNVLCLILQYL